MQIAVGHAMQLSGVEWHETIRGRLYRHHPQIAEFLQGVSGMAYVIADALLLPQGADLAAN